MIHSLRLTDRHDVIYLATITANTNVAPIVCEGSMLVFVWYELLYVHFSFAIILTRKRELVALLLLSFACLVTVNVLSLFLSWMVCSV